MCYKTILRNCEMLMFIPDCYNDQNIYNKAIDNYPHALRSINDCYKTPKMCDKPDSTYPFKIQFAPDRSKTQKCVIKLLILV